MLQDIIVYIIIALALLGACRFGYRKIQALKKKRSCTDCISCPLKNECSKPMEKAKKKDCCCG